MQKESKAKHVKRPCWWQEDKDAMHRSFSNVPVCMDASCETPRLFWNFRSDLPSSICSMFEPSLLQVTWISTENIFDIPFITNTLLPTSNRSNHWVFQNISMIFSCHLIWHSYIVSDPFFSPLLSWKSWRIYWDPKGLQIVSRSDHLTCLPSRKEPDLGRSQVDGQWKSWRPDLRKGC